MTCPSCGAHMDLDVLLAHEDSRRALGRLALLSVPCAKRAMQYIRLFKPQTRQMSHSRVVTLIEELLPDLHRRAITHNGREWAADLETWSIAFERVLDRRDNGKLTLPLKSHGYLYEVIAGMADKMEAATERERESARRKHRNAGAAGAAGSAGTGGTGDELQPVAAVVQSAATVLSTGPAADGPSRYAQKVRAEIEARRQARELELQRARETAGQTTGERDV